MVVFQIGNRHFSLEEFRLYELEHTKTRNYYDFRIIFKDPKDSRGQGVKDSSRKCIRIKIRIKKGVQNP